MHRILAKNAALFPARGRSYRQLYGASLLLVVLCLLLLAVNVRELRLMHEEARRSAVPSINEPAAIQPPDAASAAAAESEKSDCLPSGRRMRQPVVWIYGQKMETGYLRHVNDVFERLGYVIGNQTSDWSVLWSHDFPFTVLAPHMRTLKPHQRVNHFPGSGVLTNKVDLVVSDIDVIPKAFRLPSQQSELLEYVKHYPGKQWVQKSTRHRGIRITSGSDLLSSVTAGELIIQEFVENPLLVDGRRFDIGLYVTITSVDPLRAYVFDGDWLIRFCSKDYLPFDPRDLGKYVIADDYTPLWEIKTLAKFYTDLGSTRKEALFSYLRSIGKNPDNLASRLQDAVRKVLYLKERGFASAASGFFSRNFFEMVRFDFVLDNDLNVYLLEVNMSPNLSSFHFPENQLLYEQLIYSTLNLVGLADPTTRMGDMSASVSGDQSTSMHVSDRDIRVHLDTCVSAMCDSLGCRHQMCKLCRGCLKPVDELTLMSAYLEHTRQMKWRRVIPQPFESQENALRWNATSDRPTLSDANRLMTSWYNGKCIQEASWCN